MGHKNTQQAGSNQQKHMLVWPLAKPCTPYAPKPAHINPANSFSRFTTLEKADAVTCE